MDKESYIPIISVEEDKKPKEEEMKEEKIKEDCCCNPEVIDSCCNACFCFGFCLMLTDT